MTRAQFMARAIHDAEKRLQIPAGWWGTWKDVTNGKVRVNFTGSCWRLRHNGKLISKHDSRSFAISKGEKL